jgi:RNA polymerase sigma factor (sigma-70 family)
MQCWEDTAAWKLFVERYQHLFQSWSRRKLKNPADVDEVNQQVYWEIARRLPGFQYNPARSFRGWLRTLHHSRMLDFLKREKRRLRRESVVSNARVPLSVSSPESSARTASEDWAPPTSLESTVRARRAIEIQLSVRSRVSDRTWAVFQEIAIDGQSIAETAQRHSMKYASAFAAHSRVCQMLRHEAERRDTDQGDSEQSEAMTGASEEG